MYGRYRPLVAIDPHTICPGDDGETGLSPVMSVVLG